MFPYDNINFAFMYIYMYVCVCMCVRGMLKVCCFLESLD